MTLKLHSREQVLWRHMHAAIDYIVWRSATLQDVFCYMYKFYMHIKCVDSLSMFTLQRNETDNIHNDIIYNMYA